MKHYNSNPNRRNKYFHWNAMQRSSNPPRSPYSGEYPSMHPFSIYLSRLPIDFTLPPVIRTQLPLLRGFSKGYRARIEWKGGRPRLDGDRDQEPRKSPRRNYTLYPSELFVHASFRATRILIVLRYALTRQGESLSSRVLNVINITTIVQNHPMKTNSSQFQKICSFPHFRLRDP